MISDACLVQNQYHLNTDKLDTEFNINATTTMISDCGINFVVATNTCFEYKHVIYLLYSCNSAYLC